VRCPGRERLRDNRQAQEESLPPVVRRINGIMINPSASPPAYAEKLLNATRSARKRPTPQMMDGTPLSTSAMKRSTAFTRAVPYSARKTPPSTPTGIPMIDGKRQ
jgi:hypothetical protein